MNRKYIVPARSLLFAVVVVLAAPLVAQAQITLKGQTMGTVQYSVKIEHITAESDATGFQAIVDRELEKVNSLMSTYRNDSEVSRFNQAKTTDWFPVSAETALVVARSLEFSELSQGAFDITVAPLVNLWHFGPNPGDRTLLPSQEQIDIAKTHVGFRKLHVRADPPALKKDDPELWIDLSAIAKGYAVDRVAQALVEAGASGVLVEVGGEVVARGKKKGGQSFRVGIVWPKDTEQTYRDVVVLDNEALATSGDYRNFTMIGGIRYSHTIEPKTGYPVDSPLASASVIAADCMTADAMATIVMVLGEDEGHALCASMQMPLLTYLRVGEDFKIRRSDDFPLAQIPELGARPSIVPIFIASAVVFGLVIIAMAVGVIFGNLRIAGSCGGLANMKDEDGNTSCALCTRPAQDCRDAKRWMNRAVEDRDADHDHPSARS